MPDISPSRRRSQFSIQTLLLVTMIIALSFGIYRAWDNEHRMAIRLSEANVLLEISEQAVERLSLDLAEQSAMDRSKLQSKTVRFPLNSPTNRPLIWNWYVSIPAGRKYVVHIATGKEFQRLAPLDRPPKTSSGSTATTMRLGPGEHEIRLIAFRHSGAGEWVQRLGPADGSLAWEGTPAVPWGEHRVFTGKGERNGDPDRPFAVGQCEVHAESTCVDGALIWLEPSTTK